MSSVAEQALTLAEQFDASVHVLYRRRPGLRERAQRGPPRGARDPRGGRADGDEDHREKVVRMAERPVMTVYVEHETGDAGGRLATEAAAEGNPGGR